MNDNVTSIHDKYKVTPKPDAQPATQPLPSTSKLPYHACGIDAPRTKLTRLMIYYHDGVVGLMTYAYLMEAIMTSHQNLSLIFTNCIITLEGRNLSKIIHDLQDERVVYLQCFHNERFEKPEEDEPIITAIERRGVHEFEKGKGK